MSESHEMSKKIDWRYGRCALDASPDQFGPFRELVSLWQSKRRGRLLPTRADFDVVDLKPWLGRIAIAKLESDPFNVHFALWGTDLTTWWGVDYTNKKLGDLATQPELFKEIEGQYFLDMKNDPFIGLVEGKLEQQYDRSQKLMGVDLPLGTNETVEKVLLVHEEMDLADSLQQLMPGNQAQFYD